MKNILIVISGLLVFLGFVGALFVFGPLRTMLPSGEQKSFGTVISDYFTGNRGQDTQKDNPLPVAGTAATPAPASWTLPGQLGRQVQVAPFVTGEAAPPLHDVVLSGGGTSTLPYIVVYFAKDQSFNITLLAEPLGDVRKAMEADLLQRLAVSEFNACSLRYVVLVPYAISTFYSGKNLGFSFCPQATQL